jgi:Winged helix DNA-binding domain
VPTTPPALSRRALNRATLCRQLLLERGALRPYEAIQALAGMQAQAPLAPHVGLWSRLPDYSPTALDELYEARRVVRSNLLRATVHLVTAEDALHWQGLLGPVGARTVQSAFGKRLVGIDLDALTGTADRLLGASALTTVELGQSLAAKFPGYDADALAYGARGRLALIHVPPRGKWNASGPTRQTTFAAWLGREPKPAPRPDELFLRYLAAFGPATVQDAQAWSGLTRLSEVVERLAPRLATFRDPAGRLLYDLPDAPRPSEFVEAPVRFLPEYDNVFFGYADRSRFIPDLRKPPIPPGNGARTGTLFVDGEWRGTWKISLPRIPKSAKADAVPVAALLAVSLFQKASAAELAAIEREGGELARFIAGPDLGVRIEVR